MSVLVDMLDSIFGGIENYFAVANKNGAYNGTATINSVSKN
jgi:hypothetical protein